MTALDTKALLPCPFCGATDMWTGFMGDDDGGYGYVECRNSCAQAHEDDEEAARKAWNTRTAPRLARRVIELEETLAQLAHAYHAAHITFGADPEQSIALQKARAALKGEGE